MVSEIECAKCIGMIFLFCLVLFVINAIYERSLNKKIKRPRRSKSAQQTLEEHLRAEQKAIDAYKAKNGLDQIVIRPAASKRWLDHIECSKCGTTGDHEMVNGKHICRN